MFARENEKLASLFFLCGSSSWRRASCVGAIRSMTLVRVGVGNAEGGCLEGQEEQWMREKFTDISMTFSGSIIQPASVQRHRAS